MKSLTGYFSRINLIVLVVFYAGAGINHFWHPLSYQVIIPPYLPFHVFLVKVSGLIEIILGLLFLFQAYRKIAAIFIIALLVIFIPVHVYMINMGGCSTPHICIPQWLAWFRLFPLQFILIWWAWKTYVWTKYYSGFL